MQALAERHGRLDILVNNAGIQHRVPLTEWADADWERVLAANLSACFRLAREAARRHAAAGPRADHQHRLGRAHPRPADHPRLRRGQGRAARPDPLHGRRARPPGDHGQRAGARLLRHRDEHRAARRTRSSPPGSSSARRSAAGPSRRSSAARWCSSRPRPAPTSTATCSRSTAASRSRSDPLPSRPHAGARRRNAAAAALGIRWPAAQIPACCLDRPVTPGGRPVDARCDPRAELIAMVRLVRFEEARDQEASGAGGGRGRHAGGRGRRLVVLLLCAATGGGRAGPRPRPTWPCRSRPRRSRSGRSSAG